MKTRAIVAATLLLTASAFADSRFASPFVSNDVKYKDSGATKATGRSGDAVLEAQALLNKNGVTDVELTANGTIQKLQIKLPDGTVENVGPAPAGPLQLHNLAPNESLELQANIQTDTRTGVVSASPAVKRRPDLLITHVGAPPHASKGVPYNISATVHEANGDSGARASCVLYANGSEVDRVNNLWIDAGGTVSCEMTHIFAAAGETSLSVAIEGVAPGDYDGANNTSSSVNVRVYDRVTALDEWMASAHEETFYRRNWSRSPTSESETLHYGWGVGVSFWTLFRGGGLDVENLRTSVHASSDGRLIHEVDDVQFQWRTTHDDWEDVTSRCAYARYDDRYSGITACQHTSPWEQTRTTVSYTMSAGSVTYISRGWYQTYVGGEPADVYSWNTNWPSEWGNRFELGNTARVHVTLSDGNRYFDTDATMELRSYGYSYPWTEWCSGSYCGGSADIYEGRDGVAGNW